MVACFKPLPLVKDGDLVALARYMIRTRGRETVRVTKVKRHAEDVDVQQGRVRLVDQQGNAQADAAADLGRRHQSEILIDARRKLLQARSHWYPFMLDLHRFIIAVARVSVNHEGKGGTAPNPLVWDHGNRPKVDTRINVDLASLPGPPGFLNGSSVQVDVVALLVLILQLGRTVSVFRLGLLLFFLHCSGLLVLLTLVILVFPFWNF